MRHAALFYVRRLGAHLRGDVVAVRDMEQAGQFPRQMVFMVH